MSSHTVFHAADVDGLVDSLPGRQYKQDPPFWVFVALQDWLREEGNANILAYDSSDSIRTHPYPTHSTGERLTPREVYFLFENPPTHVASQLPRCYCPGHEDEGPDLVRSFVVRNKKSPRLGEYGLTCGRRKNRCGYFAWLSDVYQAADLDLAPVGADMLAHIGDAERKDVARSQKLATKKRALKTHHRRPESDYGTSSGADASSDAYSSEPEVAAARVTERPAIPSEGDGLLAAHARYSSPMRAKRAVSPPRVDRGLHSEAGAAPPSSKLRRTSLSPPTPARWAFSNITHQSMSAADDLPPQPAITLHPPLTTNSGSLAERDGQQPPPGVDWLAGSWHVTHSALPMWRSKRRVVITYTALPESKLDDLVEYDDGKPKTVRGVDTPLAGAGGWAWDWRGKGWLAIASSRWEVLGYGDEGTAGAGEEGGTGEGEERARQWVVTYFAKTLFTPAGIDIYSRHPGGLLPETVGSVKEALAGTPDDGVRKLAEGLFEVKMD